MRTVDVAVTFESSGAQPPLTWRGQVRGTSLTALVRRAAADAVRACPGQRWESVVVLVTKRRDAGISSAAADAPDPAAAR